MAAPGLLQASNAVGMTIVTFLDRMNRPRWPVPIPYGRSERLAPPGTDPGEATTNSEIAHRAGPALTPAPGGTDGQRLQAVSRMHKIKSQ